MYSAIEADQTDNADEDSPRLLIGTGQAITRNTRQISDLRTMSTQQNIFVYWNMTPLSVDGFPCCPFTLLEVYPLNAAGRKIPGESIVLLKPNVTEYPVNISHIRKELQVQEYMICVRLWHRFAGKERKLDEDCVKTRAVVVEKGDNTVLIVFGIVLGVNAVLLLGAVVLIIIKRRRRTSSFTMKKWWHDVSEILQSQPSRASLESRLTMSTSQRRPSGLSAGSLNNGISVPASPSISHSRLAISTVSGPVMPIGTCAIGNEYTYARCLNNQVYDLFLQRQQHHYCPASRSTNEICTVRNGLFNDPASVVIV
ncbi:uncharacterized protein LOC129585059 [Paramacrobiotus metropolitanus]|uniref:uncharacterized protein LOC129585059 n=1 Tax=Paramacrobiotus metropolitanus TaxID=2943436 RepID=UPI0024455FFB|nr:uncharacterized protein LOC129585059 [Paramacrobiotus metropolitanus]